jgi:hypothetical protein
MDFVHLDELLVPIQESYDFITLYQLMDDFFLKFKEKFENIDDHVEAEVFFLTELNAYAYFHNDCVKKVKQIRKEQKYFSVEHLGLANSNFFRYCLTALSFHEVGIKRNQLYGFLHNYFIDNFGSKFLRGESFAVRDRFSSFSLRPMNITIDTEAKMEAFSLGAILRFNIYVFCIFCFIQQNRFYIYPSGPHTTMVIRPGRVPDGEYGIAQKLGIPTNRNYAMWKFSVIFNLTDLDQSPNGLHVEKIDDVDVRMEDNEKFYNVISDYLFDKVLKYSPFNNTIELKETDLINKTLNDTKKEQDEHETLMVFFNVCGSIDSREGNW